MQVLEDDYKSKLAKLTKFNDDTSTTKTQTITLKRYIKLDKAKQRSALLGDEKYTVSILQVFETKLNEKSVKES